MFSLAYFTAAIFPSIPLFPNPPGTNIASNSPNFPFAVSAVISSESIYPISTFTLFANPACLILSATERYESSNFMYLPTIATLTILSSTFLILSIIVSHSLLFGSILSNLKCLQTSFVSPSSSNINGTAYRLSTVLFCITLSGRTLQCSAILYFIVSSIGSSDLHTNISGLIPNDCNSFTECCVGFDFNSFEPAMYGNKVT